MENVTVMTAVDSGKTTKNGDKIINVTISDGRSGACTDRRILEFIGKEVELDVKAGKEYKGVMQYWFNFPKDNNNGKKFPQKDCAFEKKRVAMECAVQISALNTKEVIENAELLLSWLNK